MTVPIVKSRSDRPGEETGTRGPVGRHVLIDDVVRRSESQQ